MAALETPTADLFDVDKRLSLKPVADFNVYLRNAFGEGACACIRCKDSGGFDAGYTQPHTFVFGGAQVHRRFASTSASDVLLALKKAWLSYTKGELPSTGELDVNAVQGFVEPGLHERLVPLLVASGLVTSRDGVLLLNTPVEF